MFADPAFEKIIAADQQARGMMIEALKEGKKNREIHFHFSESLGTTTPAK